MHIKTFFLRLSETHAFIHSSNFRKVGMRYKTLMKQNAADCKSLLTSSGVRYKGMIYTVQIRFYVFCKYTLTSWARDNEKEMNNL